MLCSTEPLLLGCSNENPITKDRCRGVAMKGIQSEYDQEHTSSANGIQMSRTMLLDRSIVLNKCKSLPSAALWSSSIGSLELSHLTSERRGLAGDQWRPGSKL